MGNKDVLEIVKVKPLTRKPGVIRIDASVHARMAVIAEEASIPVSELATTLVRFALDRVKLVETKEND